MTEQRWHLVGHASELRNAGDFVLLPWAIDSEVAVVNINGKRGAFDNRCTHRGARIHTDLCGNREPRCAYHGRLVTEANCAYPLNRIGDWWFVGDRSGPEADLGEPFAAAASFLINSPALVRHSQLSFVMDCHWTVAVENALDSEHIAHIHAAPFGKLDLRSKGFSHSYKASFETFDIDDRVAAHMAAINRCTAVEGFDGYRHAYLYPHACLSSTAGATYSLQHYFPRADGKTQFIHRLYTPPSHLKWFYDSVARMNEQVFREDAEICARVPRGYRGTLGIRDARIVNFREMQR